MAWLDEVRKRIAIDEGDRAKMYRDSLGIPTIGTGFNLTRPDARQALAKCGVSDIDGVINGTVALTPAQDMALFDYAFSPIESQARASLATTIYDSMTDARRFVICDLVYNLGNDGWCEFTETRALLNEAQRSKLIGSPSSHAFFDAAAQHLASSLWFGQVGNRARRNVAMIRSGVWCDPYGDGSQ